MDVSREQAALRQFAHDRDWDQFHTPKNLAMALSGEVGELLAIFQWLTPEESTAIMGTGKAQHVRDELADVLIYTLRLADVLDVDDILDARTGFGMTAKGCGSEGRGAEGGFQTVEQHEFIH